MKSIRDRIRIASSDDSGMSLIEVLIAISLIAIVATAGLSFYIGSLNSAIGQQRRQVAITIANQAMENVSAQSVLTSPTTMVSYLYDGRYKTTVTDAWTTYAGREGVNQTYPRWDPTATTTSTAKIKVTEAVTRNGTNYTSAVLIGTCYQLKSGGDCIKTDGNTFAPTATPTNYTPMIRVVVIVKWTAGAECKTSGCFYEVNTLVDPNTDLEWNSHG